jgi:chromosomal replication initiation ATPase DnaA
MGMSHQLPLELKHIEAYARDDLIVTPANEALYDTLSETRWVNPHLWLTGPDGSGKTHWGHLFAEGTETAFIHAVALDEAALTRLSGRDVVVDDAEKADETNLFHLINQSLANQKRLLLLSCKHPLDLTPALPDLASRLKAMRVIDVPEPDETLLRGLLIRLFAQRSISPSPEFIEFIARRMERSLPAAQKIVTEIEHYANGRPFNRTLAKDFLDQNDTLSWLDDDEPNDTSGDKPN